MWLKNKNGEVFDCIWSQNEVKQECRLGSLLFALSLQGIFEVIESKFPSALIDAIMYDFYIVGPPDDAVEGYKYLEELCIKDVSLMLKKSKCKLLHFHWPDFPEKSQSAAKSLTLKVVTKITKVLGAPIGAEDADVTEMSIQIIDKYHKLFDRFMDDMLFAFVMTQILRMFGFLSVNYLTRVVHPKLLQQAAVVFDSGIREAYLHMLKIQSDEMNFMFRAQVSLPIRFDGMKSRDHTHISHYVFGEQWLDLPGISFLVAY